ncbi:Acetyltransferase (GNAT) domain-containing protein [Aquiflexum balticum DSM 16537]|uniref:Acetyltransferase (GNAT) domain-containing protein n=1 Tax=Aquiflexum balticum DSM 16537 TaxID=758820 RepID=A0A1W2HC45_9BACT|nr:GNAT family N-acetyltransferase [Aquiflexum balticum]SMD46288.1 Acetyltransferase (GNAT) domain-containing protein [Aquiflexum balticum DSM 16537]
MDLKCFVIKGIEAENLFKNPLFIQAWDVLFDSCPWATVFQSKAFVLNWYQCFESFSKIIVTDWDGQRMTGLLTLTQKNKVLTAAGLDLAEYQAWLSSQNFSDKFLKKALFAINEAFPNQTLYLKYLTAKVPLNLFVNKGFFTARTFLRQYVHPLMETNVEVLESELKKKNKKEKINRLKRLGDLEFFEVKGNDHFRALIDEMSLQSDFRKGAFYNKTYFHDEPERKTFLLKLFKLGLLHVSGLSVDGKLIASNAGIMGPDVVHLQGINSHSPFYSKYSPGILQFLMLGIALKNSGFRYFDLTPGGADGYKSALATETSLAYEFWFTSPWKTKKKRWLELVKNWIKPRLQDKSFLGEDLSNLNVAGMRLKLKLKFALKRLKSPRKEEYVHFLEGESIIVPLQDKLKNTTSLESLSEAYILRENHIPDLFLFDENASLFPRMDVFADCMIRLEYGQTMFTLTKGKDLRAICWFIPLTAKASKTETKEITRPPIFVASYYKDLSSDELLWLFMKLENDFLDDSVENLNLEIGKNQKTLLDWFKS